MKKISQEKASNILQGIDVVLMDGEYPLIMTQPPNDENEDLILYMAFDDPEEGYVELLFPKENNKEIEVDGGDMYLVNDAMQRVKFTMYQPKNIE